MYRNNGEAMVKVWVIVCFFRLVVDVCRNTCFYVYCDTVVGFPMGRAGRSRPFLRGSPRGTCQNNGEAMVKVWLVVCFFRLVVDVCVT